EVPLEEHDRIMSVVLGMSHAVNLVFALALARYGLTFAELGPVASNTFSNQIQTTAQVASENPVLYHQIQALNRNTPEVFQQLAQALEAFREASTPDRSQDFLALMAECRSFFDG
ncbi:MAG: prephenate dehydrogenase dimerization domain-containing protein, partial [Candidatus Eremiobacterota bacterium]